MLFIAPLAKGEDAAPELKVHLNVADVGKTGLTEDQIKSIFTRTVHENDNSIVFVDEKGNDVKELNVTVEQFEEKDKKDENADPPDKVDGVEVKKEDITVVDADPAVPDVEEKISKTDKDSRLMLILSLKNAEGVAKEVKLEITGDSFDQEFEAFLKDMKVWMFIRVSFMKA